MVLEVQVLGPVEVVDTDGSVRSVGGSRPRAMLAALALRAEQPVSSSRLVEDVWGVDLPRDPLAAVRTTIRRVRAVVGADRLVRQAPGYLLRGVSVDLVAFEQLVAHAGEKRAQGELESARADLAAALALWRGEALEGIGDAPLVTSARPRLTEAWFAALEQRVAVDLELGRHLELVPELVAVVGRHPLQERLCGQLMVALHRSGRQADALAAFARARDTIVDTLGAEPSAALHRLHERILREDPELLAGDQSTTTIDAPMTPAVPPGARGRGPRRARTSFVGRESELSLVSARLDTSRLVTVVGVGGGGKTRLACEAAEAWAAHHGGVPVWFVDLSTVADGRRVAGAIAEAVGVRAVGDPTVALERALAESEGVVLLDNCEHVVAAAAGVVEGLLGGTARLRVLATSREPLACQGEQLVTLGPLAHPRVGSGGWSAEQALGYEAVRLFVDRAQATDAAFALTERDATAVAQICGLVSGLPLAVELAASQVRFLPCQRIAELLEESERLPRRPPRTAPERHRTIEAALAWSYELLDRHEQRLLQRLSTTSGEFPLDAAEAFADRAGPDPHEVLAGLVDRSLVEVAPERAGEPRFELLEPVRRFAATRLSEQDEADAARRAHARWVLDVAERLDVGGREGFVGAHADRMLAEIDNARSALAFTIAAGDAELAQRLTAALGGVWWAHGLLVEGIAWANETTKLTCGEDEPIALAGGLAVLALLEEHRMRPQAPQRNCAWLRRARRHARRSLALVADTSGPSAARHRRRAELTTAATELALRDHGEPDGVATSPAQVRAREPREDPCDWWATLLSYDVRGMAETADGDYAAAGGVYDLVIERSRDRGCPVGEALGWFKTAELEALRGRHDHARAALEANLEVQQASGTDPVGQRHTYGRELLGLARICLWQGALHDAWTYASRAYEAARAVDDRAIAAQARRLLDDLPEPART